MLQGVAVNILMRAKLLLLKSSQSYWTKCPNLTKNIDYKNMGKLICIFCTEFKGKATKIRSMLAGYVWVYGRVTNEGHIVYHILAHISFFLDSFIESKVKVLNWLFERPNHKKYTSISLWEHDKWMQKQINRGNKNSSDSVSNDRILCVYFFFIENLLLLSICIISDML